MTWLQLAGGLALLAAGGEFLVRGASGLASRIGVSHLVIGLTVVALGTSAPEFVVSILSAARGEPDIAVGNVVGSNIFNVLLTLGLCAAFRPLEVAAVLIRRDVPVMIGASVLFFLLGLDGRISPLEGAGFALALAAFVAYTVRESRRESAVVRQEYEEALAGVLSRRLGWIVDLLLAGAGLGLLVLGARWLVASAVVMAGVLGVSDAVIGLTVVAVGTSLPEVATSLVATLRGQRDIAVGNIVGSNIFNIFGIVGVSAVVSGGGLPVARSIEHFDLPVMTAVAIACLPFLASHRRLARWEGMLFLGYYGAYTAYLVLSSSGHEALPLYSRGMMMFVLPLTAITLLAVWIRAYRTSRRESGVPGTGDRA